MPTTKLKNAAYRLALPFLAPSPDRCCVTRMDGTLRSGEKAFLRLIRRHHVLGSVCLLADSRRRTVVWTRSLSPDHDPLRHPVFRAASITKMASALMMMLCVDRGLLSLDSPVVSVMPSDFAQVKELEGVTLRHLLSHTSGLADPPDLETSLEQGKSILAVLKGCRFALPGESFRYSNLGFGLIGCLLEALFGKPFPAVFDDYLFRPLGSAATMDASSLDSACIMQVTRIMPYRPGQDVRVTALGSRPILSPDPYSHYGHTAGSMYTDAESLLKLVNCLIRHGEPLIRKDLGLEMTKVHASYGALSPTLSYGLGLLRIEDPSISESAIWGHQGFAYGCADGAFWEESTGRILLFLNGGCSEARVGRLGLCNRDLLRWAFRKEFPAWN